MPALILWIYQLWVTLTIKILVYWNVSMLSCLPYLHIKVTLSIKLKLKAYWFFVYRSRLSAKQNWTNHVDLVSCINFSLIKTRILTAKCDCSLQWSFSMDKILCFLTVLVEFTISRDRNILWLFLADMAQFALTFAYRSSSVAKCLKNATTWWVLSRFLRMVSECST